MSDHSGSAGKQRSAYLDVVKGFAIVLVTLGHCVQYGNGRDFVQSMAFFDDPLFKLIYSFHMPLFALVSGYLLYASLQHRSEGELVMKRLSGLFVPIVSFCVMARLVELAKLIVKREPLTFEFVTKSIHYLLYEAWYLWAMLYCSLVVLLIHRFFRDHWLCYVMVMILGLILPQGLNSQLYFYLWPYFAAGYWWNHLSMDDRYETWSRTGRLLAIGIAGVMWLMMLVPFTRDHYIYMSGMTLLGRGTTELSASQGAVGQLGIDFYRWIIGFVGCIFVMGLLWEVVRAMEAKHRESVALAFLGERTLGIYMIGGYLVHWVLERVSAGWTLNYALDIVETGVLLLLCLVVIEVMKKLPLIRTLFLGEKG